MSKKPFLFVKIIYYIFTFAIGVLIAVVLPNYFMYSLSYDQIRDSLNDGDYASAMVLVGGYFNKEEVYQLSFEDGGGIVLFEAATIQYPDEEDTESTLSLQKSYAGFLYGIKDLYKTESTKDNKTILLVTDSSSVKHDYTILNYDANEDEVNDSIATVKERGFVYIDIPITFTSSITNLEFIDCEGNTFVSLNMNLNFNTTFFTDVNDFVNEYNTTADNDKLTELDEIFRAKNPNYTISSYGGSQKKAIFKACVWVVIYFVVIYTIADFLIGKHFILRFIKFVLSKLFKVKFKDKNTKRIERENEAVFGHDYYSQVTMKLDVGDVDIDTSVTIKYNKEDALVEFNLLKEDNYTQTKRIKAGVYVNPWIEIDSNYKAINLPENLMVDGYKMEVIVKIEKLIESEEVK